MATVQLTREERRQQKTLDEARKAGAIPAQKDEEGKDINPHMPQFITQAPWYISSKPGLKHQRRQFGESKTSIEEWYPRGEKGFQAIKFRKNACQNCGAATHTEKFCCERPRQIGAKYTGKSIQADEIIQDLNLDYDAKRDRWNGYNPDDYKDVMKEFEIYDEEWKKQQKLQKQKNNEEGEKEEEDLDDEYKIKDFEQDKTALTQIKDPKIKTQTLDLRIREDTANYLLNLDPNSAFYDPKARAMRSNPNPHLPPEQQAFKGLNDQRLTGETVQLYIQNKFAWDRITKDKLEINPQAVPTLTEKIFKDTKKQEIQQKQEKAKELFSKYGGEEYVKTIKEIQDSVKTLKDDNDIKDFKQSQNLRVETKKISNSMKKSRYPEDQYINNHTSVWGSWWNETLGWGYSCCNSNDKLSMCEGEKGKRMAIIREYQLKKQSEDQIRNNLEQDIESKGQEKQYLKLPNSNFFSVYNIPSQKNLKDNQALFKQFIDEKIIDVGQSQADNGQAEDNQKSLQVDTIQGQDNIQPLDKEQKEVNLKQETLGTEENAKTQEKTIQEKKQEEPQSLPDNHKTISEDMSLKSNKQIKKFTEKQKQHLESLQLEQTQLLQLDDLDMKNLDSKKVEKAVETEKDRLRTVITDDRKRRYNKIQDQYKTVTAEDYEAYLKCRKYVDDPMNNIDQ